LVVQALKALGREHVDQKVVERIRQQLELKACDRILKIVYGGVDFCIFGELKFFGCIGTMTN
jgi:hypothetical protein